MATRKAPVKKSAAVEEVEAVVESPAELSVTKIIRDGINRVVDASGVDVQKKTYKALRAIAFTAFTEAIQNGDFEDLVDRAIAGLDDLPTGWKLERDTEASKTVEEEVVEAPVRKAAPRKPRAAKAAAPTEEVDASPVKKAPARRRPVRSAS